MTNINGNIPSIKNSKSIDQVEIENAKQNMNFAPSKTMILGAELTSNISNSTNLGNTNSVMNFNSSTSVATEKLQNVNPTQKDGR